MIGPATAGSWSRQEIVQLAAAGNPLPSPVEAYFEVANRSNSKRATCPLTSSQQEGARQLSLAEFQNLVAQLPDLRRAVMQGVGEPLLNRDLAPIIAHLTDRGLHVVFNTKVALLTRPELPGVVDLAARIGVDEVYLQRMVFGFGDGSLARADRSIYTGYRAEAESIITEADRRATAHGVRLRGADALSPRESILDRPPQTEPGRACSRPLRLAYVTAQGTALPCCIAPFTDAPFDSLQRGNYLRDGVQTVWTGEAYRRFREQLSSPEPPACCRNCGLAWSL